MEDTTKFNKVIELTCNKYKDLLKTVNVYVKELNLSDEKHMKNYNSNYEQFN